MIFDIEKNQLTQLSDSQLEELIARLCESEIARIGYSPAYVSWSGSINAPDEGIDIKVEVPVKELNTGYLIKPSTVFQAKKHSMPRGQILKEMFKGSDLSPSISEQASKNGSYIIVSLEDDCSPTMLKNRKKAMLEAIEGQIKSDNFHFDFYDRSKLAQWTRQHPSVLLWVKSKLGQEYSGWKAYGSWSNPPKGVDDSFIFSNGVTVTLPSRQDHKLNISDAIEPIRELVRSTDKAVRITGLSGVGKTRIVQALFDENIGQTPLDRTSVVYVDTGAKPEPSATVMLERLIATNQNAIMVLDNCPSDLHSKLAEKVSSSGGEVKLITVEYDIQEDKPQTTEVINVEANGPELAEKLLNRRFPAIGQNDARRIAEFAVGNSRVSLAIAERVVEGESLAQLSDAQLFNRLFEQRKAPDNELREQAEILSLVYSFSISKDGNAESELEVLGSAFGYSFNQLYRATKKLSDRHIVQRRGHWRAILPHAIATKLAEAALASIPIEQIRDTFESPGRERLLMSFAHRLSLLHNNAEAHEIVGAWFENGGILENVFDLDDTKLRVLEYIAPVAPDKLLTRLEKQLIQSGSSLCNIPNLSTIMRALQLSAYEPEYFERCLKLLIEFEEHSEPDNGQNKFSSHITSFFQAYLSGTHATLEQRIGVMNECLNAKSHNRRKLGLAMLATALSGPPWTRVATNYFGARPRDFGSELNYEQLTEWRSAFIDIAVELGNSDNYDFESSAREVLARNYRTLWQHNAIKEKLIYAAGALHKHRPWHEGLKAVRSIIYFDHRRRDDCDEETPIPENLQNLLSTLKITGLVPSIRAYVLGKNNDHWALDENFDHEQENGYRESETRLKAKSFQLGAEFSSSQHSIDELCPRLFSSDWMPYRVSFGEGLAKGTNCLSSYWRTLVKQLELTEINQGINISVLLGFLEEANSADPRLVQKLLDESAQHPILKRFLVALHPGDKFSVSDLERCLSILGDPDVEASMFEPILWQSKFSDLPKSLILDLAHRLLAEANGAESVLHALTMIITGAKDEEDALGLDFRSLGLTAAKQKLITAQSEQRPTAEYEMESVIKACLTFRGNDKQKLEWVDTIFQAIKGNHGLFHGYENAIEITATLMPQKFLDRIFEGSTEEQQNKLFYLERGVFRRSPISQIDEETLIDWCRRKNNLDVWIFVANCIHLWFKSHDDENIKVTQTAINVLEASPYPEAILRAFANRVAPSSWSGSRVTIMQQRADALSNISKHQNKKISGFVKSIVEELTDRIDQERNREQREDALREQRFE
jgi:hypothetical protein